MKNLEEIIFPIITEKTEIDKRLWKEIKALFLLSFTSAGFNYPVKQFLWFLINCILKNGIKKQKSLIQIEQRLRSYYRKLINAEKIRLPNARIRSEHNFNIVKKYIVGEKILDLGAGDGLLSELIKKRLNKKVILVDVIDYNYTDLPVIIYPQGGKLPLEDKSIDCTIIYVVLHHSDDPELLINEAARVTKNRIIVVEGYAEDKDIIVKNSFIDWFYNRVVRDCDINIPLNFKTQQEWDNIFQKSGFKIVKADNIGIDEEKSPEHHILFILEPIKAVF